MTPRRIHYAWWIVTAAVVIEFFGIGFGIFGLSALYPYLIAEFGWSRTEVMASMTVIVTSVAIFGPITGTVTDRWSIRRLMMVGSVVEAAGLFGLSQVETRTQYLAACAVLGVGLSGVTVLPNQILVTRWFRSGLGTVNGVITAATMLGGALAPLFATRIAETAGWRAAFVAFAASVAVFPPLMAAFVVRDRPSDLDLSPFGETDAPPMLPPPRGAVAAVLRDPRLWLLGVGLFGASWPCYAATKHIILYLREIGVEPLPAAATLSWMLGFATFGRLLFGFLWDFFPARTILLLDVSLLAGASVLLLWASDPTVRWIYVVVFGLGYGGLMPLIPLTVVSYFGRQLMGTVTGCFKAFYDLAAALAPIVTAQLTDRSGSYETAFVVNAILPLAGLAVIALLVPAPRLKPDPAPEPVPITPRA